MTNGAVITFAPPVFERDDLLVFALLDNFGSHFRPGNERIAVRNVLVVGEHQHLAKGRGLSRIDIQKIDIDRVAFRDAILPTTSLDDCVGHNVLSGEKAAQNPTEARAWQEEWWIEQSLARCY